MVAVLESTVPSLALEREAVGAVVVGGRGVAPGAVGVDRGRAVAGAGDLAVVERVAVGVGAHDRARLAGVLVARARVGRADGDVVDRVDRDRHRHRVGVDGAVVGPEREAVGAVVVGGRGVAPVAVRCRPWPCRGWGRRPCCRSSGSPSASVHTIVPDWPASSSPELESAVHTGAAFVAETVRSIVALFESADPSLALNVKLSEPL